MEVKTAADTAQHHTISCTECQRRKQKCSRQWPCNHCQSRKVPHMCHFASKKATLGPESKNGIVNGVRKRKGPEPAIIADEEPLDEEHNAADVLRALGYLQSEGDPLFFGMLSERSEGTRLTQENDVATKDVPPRIYCDAMVQNYIDVCNYWYYPIYPPQFLEGYNTWWENRSARKKNKPEFTCLLLRVLANSTQCVHPDLRKKLESELGETLQDLTEKYHEAAERLSNLIPPGVGGLEQVQQLFMTAVWLKGESLFVNAWHSLSDAIRYAQEVGLHNESLWDGLSEFECEIRRRLWTTLYLWDRLIGMMLSRPLLINERHCNVKHPSVNLEYDPTKPDLPCPHAHMVLQQKLCEAVIGDFDGQKVDMTGAIAEMVMGSVNKWLDSLPPFHRMKDTDTRYDDTNRYLVLQRLQTTCMGYNAVLSVLKSYITLTYKHEPALTPAKLNELQNIAIDKCVALMDIAQKLADVYVPDYNKYFLIVFTPFDTAALLSSAIIHDTKRVLPRRTELLQTIATGHGLLKRLRKVAKTGAVAESVVSQLISKFNLTPEEQAIFYSSSGSSSAGSSPPNKRQATSAGSRKGSESSVPGLSPDSQPPEETGSTSAPSITSASEAPPATGLTSAITSGTASPPEPAMSRMQSAMPELMPNAMSNAMPQQSFPPTTMYAAPAFSNDFAVQEMQSFDFGPLDGIFSWQSVNLFEPTDESFNGTGFM